MCKNYTKFEKQTGGRSIEKVRTNFVEKKVQIIAKNWLAKNFLFQLKL